MHSPRGSEYPNSRVLGPQIHTLNGFWTLKPYYLGTWTLRVLLMHLLSSRACLGEKLIQAKMGQLVTDVPWPACSLGFRAVCDFGLEASADLVDCACCGDSEIGQHEDA